SGKVDEVLEVFEENNQQLADFVGGRVKEVGQVTNEIGQAMNSVGEALAQLHTLSTDGINKTVRVGEMVGAIGSEKEEDRMESEQLLAEKLQEQTRALSKMALLVQQNLDYNPARLDRSLTGQMEEIRDDINMMMRTLGMKIHQNSLQKFREVFKQQERERSDLKEQDDQETRTLESNVDLLITKYAKGGDALNRAALVEMLKDYTKEYRGEKEGAVKLHWTPYLKEGRAPKKRPTSALQGTGPYAALPFPAPRKSNPSQHRPASSGGSRAMAALKGLSEDGVVSSREVEIKNDDLYEDENFESPSSDGNAEPKVTFV
ncbi:hypothetical protein CYMTET_10666, partial [Cymbomonas tetramitiformis]